MHVTETITISRTPEEVYTFWSKYEEFPSFMLDLESVHRTVPRLLHFKSTTDDGESLEWDAEITAEIPFSEIAWKYVKGSFENSGTVTFKPATGRRGTVVRVDIDFPLSTTESIKAKIATLFGEDPRDRVRRTLQAAKQILETGGIMISDATISAKHPAQPPKDSELPAALRKFHRGYESIGEWQ